MGNSSANLLVLDKGLLLNQYSSNTAAEESAPERVPSAARICRFQYLYLLQALNEGDDGARNEI